MANQLDLFRKHLESRVKSLIGQGKTRKEALSQIESSIKGVEGWEKFVRGLISGEDVSGLVPGLQKALDKPRKTIDPVTGIPQNEVETQSVERDLDTVEGRLGHAADVAAERRKKQKKKSWPIEAPILSDEEIKQIQQEWGLLRDEEW
jgi:hypothetical protein